MDLLLTHLRETAERRGMLRDPHELRAFLRRFEAGRHDRSRRAALAGDWGEHAQGLILDALQELLRADRFDVLDSNTTAGLLSARFSGEYHCNQDWLATVRLQEERLRLCFEIHVEVDPRSRVTIAASAPLDSWLAQLPRRLLDRLGKAPPVIRRAAMEVHRAIHAPEVTADGERGGVVLPPGAVLDRPFAGGLRDYSGCARMDELRDLVKTPSGGRDHVLPLGRYRFDVDTGAAAPLLYLGRSPRTGARTEYQGALIVAPQNAGKTRLILRWAKAANRAGYSALIIDVKGNLYDKLLLEGLSGTVYHFSTEPGAPSDRINFLGGLGPPTDRRLSWRVRQLVHAILPEEVWEKSQHLYYFQNCVVWLRSLIHVLKLYELYYPERFAGRSADLCDLFEMITDYPELCRRINEMIWDEDNDRVHATAATFGGVRAWLRRMALLFAPGDVPGGQRRGEYQFLDLAQGILTPLEPFAPGGILAGRVRDSDDGSGGRLFRMEDLGRPEQVTIVLTAREQELDDSVAVVSMAVKRLQHLLFERMGARDPREVLLLLDETRRIRGFRAGEYITFAREAKAGCVLVYQSLDQIKDEREITEILENVGTQIYLGSLMGDTARRFIDLLPKRHRATFSQTLSMSRGQGAGGSWEKHQELIDSFNTGDLHKLPAGEWPALVYIRDHLSRKPFLVDMDEAPLEA